MTEKKFLSFTDAAEKILKSEGKSLSYKQILKKATEQELIHTEADDPALSLYVSLRTEIKRRDQRKEPQRFSFHGNGIFSLKELSTPLPPKTKTALEEVKESRRRVCNQLFEQLTKDNRGSEFETMVSDLLLEMGYQKVEVIGGSDDHGVDIICEQRGGIIVERIAIQCKCKKLINKVGPKDISTLRDNLSTHQCQKGILITTSELNEDAKAKAKEAGKEPIHFIEHDEILDLFAEHEIGLKSQTLKYFELDAGEYDFLNETKGKGDRVKGTEDTN